MKFGGIGPLELVIILAIALIIFGPKNLPKIGASIGKTIRNIRAGMDDASGTGASAKASGAKHLEGDAAQSEAPSETAVETEVTQADDKA